MILNLYKEKGETPLELIERFKIKKFKDFGDQKMTYLGRLDPLAEGVLLVGSGEEDTKQERREEFFNLDKEYEFVALFGFATDTYDVMGKITHPSVPLPSLTTREGKANTNTIPSEMDLIKICKIFEGEREQKYPEYSSKMIATQKKKHHPLEQPGYFSTKKSPHSPASRGPRVAFEEDVSFSAFPHLNQGEGSKGGVKKINIYNLQFQKLQTLSPKELFGRLLMDISRVKGDFRQAEILEIWKDRLLGFPSPAQGEGDTKCGVGFFSAHVSSGTYIRSLVNDMGQTLGCGATTLSIKRTRVGDYKIEDSLRF